MTEQRTIPTPEQVAKALPGMPSAEKRRLDTISALIVAVYTSVMEQLTAEENKRRV